MHTYIHRDTCVYTSIHRNTRIYSIVYIKVYVHTSWYPCVHVANKSGYMSLHARASNTSRYIHPTGRAQNTSCYIVLHDGVHHRTRSYTRTYATSQYTHIRPYPTVDPKSHRDTWSIDVFTRPYIAIHTFTRPYISIHVANNQYTSQYIRLHVHTSWYPCLHVANKSGYIYVHPRTPHIRTYSTSRYIEIHPSDRVGPKYIVLHRVTWWCISMYTLIHRDTCDYNITYINVYVHTSWYTCLHVANILGYMSLHARTPEKMRTFRICAHMVHRNTSNLHGGRNITSWYMINLCVYMSIHRDTCVYTPIHIDARVYL
jgi:hypothetical protein